MNIYHMLNSFTQCIIIIYFSDDEQFPQYQQNVQSPLILTPCTHKKPTTYDVRDPCHNVGQTQNCGIHVYGKVSCWILQQQFISEWIKQTICFTHWDMTL
jgi:hypothetical protein